MGINTDFTSRCVGMASLCSAGKAIGFNSNHYVAADSFYYFAIGVAPPRLRALEISWSVAVKKQCCLRFG